MAKTTHPGAIRHRAWQGTEHAFCGRLLDNKKHGIYACVCCKLPLFASNAKFNSGTGWPSFFQAVCDENVVTEADGMFRVEFLCPVRLPPRPRI